MVRTFFCSLLPVPSGLRPAALTRFAPVPTSTRSLMINCRFLTVLIGLVASWWTVFETIAPATVQASTDRLTYDVEPQIKETYETLEHRAEDAAMALAQQSFDHDSQISKVVVMVTATNKGAVAPILMLQVSRSQWENRLQPQRWITYFNASRTLLGLTNSLPAKINTPNINSLPPNALPPELPGSSL